MHPFIPSPLIHAGPVDPVVCPQVIQKGQAFVPLQPLCGANLQTTGVQTSRWIALPAGSYLQLTLTVAALVGTLAVYLETCNQVDRSGAAVDSPRFLGAFKQTPGAAMPSAVQMEGEGRCDNFVRVIARPGAGPGQTATWSITGRAITAAYASLM